MENEEKNYRGYYEIIDNQNESYLDILNSVIHFKTPVPKSNFTIVDKYNLSMPGCATILVHISNNTRDPAGTFGSQKPEFVEKDLAFSDFKLDRDFLIEKGKLQVIVYNDFGSDFSADNLNSIINLVRVEGYNAYLVLCNNIKVEGILDPDEKCGGVLIVS